MAELTIGDMIARVPEGTSQIFERAVDDRGEERFFRVWQNWDYRPGRLEWRNNPSQEDRPWLLARNKRARTLATLPTPDAIFKGPARQVVDFYGTGTDAYFISDDLFRLIDEIDPDSLEHAEFRVRAQEADLPFHAVMPRRIVEAIDTRRTTVAIKDEDYAGWFFRTVRFPEGTSFRQRPARRSRLLFRLRRARLVLVEGSARARRDQGHPRPLCAVRGIVAAPGDRKAVIEEAARER